MTRQNEPPRHLRPDTKRWWREVTATFELEGHHLRILQRACEAWDRGEQARAVLEKKGLTFTDARGDLRPRPEVKVERDAAIAFARLLRELRLDVEPDPPRPPGLRGGRRYA